MERFRTFETWKDVPVGIWVKFDVAELVFDNEYFRKDDAFYTLNDAHGRTNAIEFRPGNIRALTIEDDEGPFIEVQAQFFVSQWVEL